MPPATPHRWQFTRMVGFDQVRIETADDLRNLASLDQKLWAALACPVRGIEMDEKTLALIDTDGDGRIRPPELLAAVRWTVERLKHPEILRESAASVRLAEIDERADPALLASARQVLKELGRPNAPDITLDDVADTTRIFAQTRFNGDGVIPADAAADEPTRRVLEDVIACMGSVPDRSGKPGVRQETVDAFFAHLAAWDAWARQGEEDAAIRVLGDTTTPAVEAWRAVRAKVDDYFARCHLIEFDGRAAASVNRAQEAFAELTAKDLSATAQEAASFPLARAEAGRALPLLEGLNPAWAKAMAAFRAAVVGPWHGADRRWLTAEEWAAVCAKLAPCDAWLAAQPAKEVAKLGTARIREILASGARERITALLGEDKALEPQAKAIADVERLVRYRRDLWTLLRNFVSFADFYAADGQALFQAGTLYLDGRACELCVRADDPGRHAALAGLAKTYLAYCDCTRPGGEKLSIAVAVTDGDCDNLMVGRNGVFYDRRGRDWDATVTKIVENPISIRQAFWSPYKKLVRMIEQFAAKRAAAADARNEARFTTVAEKAAAPDQAAAAAAKPGEPPRRVDAGTLAAVGVAAGLLGTTLVYLLGWITGLFRLPFWQLVLVFLVIVLLISTPAMLIAWFKLRQRNLAPILDACGWAVNARVRMNVRFGRELTELAQLPPNAATSPEDRFVQRPSAWGRAALVVIAVAWAVSLLNHFGFIHAWTDGTWVEDALGRPLGSPPAAEPATTTPFTTDARTGTPR